MSVTHVNKNSFRQEVLESDKPVLLDFWAPWCGPCRMIAPVLDEIAREYPQIKVCKVNVDEEPELANQFGIVSIPSLFAVKGGQVVNRTVGVSSKQELLELMK